MVNGIKKTGEIKRKRHTDCYRQMFSEAALLGSDKSGNAIRSVTSGLRLKRYVVSWPAERISHGTKLMHE